MTYIDFSNRQNRFITEEEVGKDYLQKMMDRVKEDTLYYPQYHIAPKHGLLNDPNGLYQDQSGDYHIFYQWFPLGTVHGLKHWYHLKTKDFVHFIDLGIAIAPDQSFDSHGCYTGMTFCDGKDVHVYYTGIVKEGENLLPATVHGVIKEGEMIKSGVIEALDLTKTTYNFRDPFTFKKRDKYYLLTGAENTQNKGVLLLSVSDFPDKEFRSLGAIKLKEEPFLGYMLECPNYFEWENQGVLLFSPQGIKSQNKYDYRNVFSVVYAVGKPLDVEQQRFDYEELYELDKGFDFYAPQIFKDNVGRMILIGWLGNSKCVYPSDTYQWAHMLTLPREVRLDKQRIVQQPLKELEALRKDSEKNLSFKKLENKSFELNFTVKPGSIVIENESHESLVFTITEDEYILDREKTTHLYNEAYGQQRVAVRACKDAHQCRIFVDQSAIEIFIDNGLTTFTARFFLEGQWQIKSHQLTFDYFSLSSIEIKKN